MSSVIQPDLNRTTTIDPEVMAFLQKVHHLWRLHQPIAASLWSPPIWDKAEDLSDEGIAAWQEALIGLSHEGAHLVRRPLPALERVIVAELRRFLNEQIVRHVQQDLYRSSAIAYLQLCAFALMPFLLSPRGLHTPVSSHDLLLSRMAMCEQWLSVGERRMERGDLAPTKQSCELAAMMSHAVIHTQHLPLFARQNLARRLEKWSQIPLSPTRHQGKRLALRAYLRDLLGIEGDAEELLEALTVYLQREVDTYNAIHAVSPVQSTLEANELNLYLAQDRHKWMRQVETIVREHLLKHTLTELGPSSDIRSMPAILATFLQDGMYLSPISLGRGAQCRGLLLENVLPASASDFAVTPGAVRAYLALMVAHELCPGHAEHVRRGLHSPLAMLYEVTRSPLGLEGWAMQAEQVLVELDHVIPEVARTVSFHRLRRLLGAVWRLREIVSGKEVADAEVKNILRLLPETAAQRLLQLLPFSNLSLISYAAGALETEQCLRAVAQIGNTVNSALVTIEVYLAWGPAAPRHVLQLVADELQRQGLKGQRECRERPAS